MQPSPPNPNFRTLSNIYFSIISIFLRRSGVSHSNTMHLIVNPSKIDYPIYQEENSSVPQTCSRNYFLVIKAAVTHWLSHGKAAQWVLDCYKSFIASLDAIYKRKSDLISHKVIASLCFLADVLRVQMFCKLFYKERGFLKITHAVVNLIQTIQRKSENRKSQKEVILVDYKSFLLELVSTVGHTRHNLMLSPSKKKQFVHS